MKPLGPDFADGPKKKKRKLSSVSSGSGSGIYSGVSVSQLLAQRERAIAAAVQAANPGGQAGAQAANGSQVNNSAREGQRHLVRLAPLPAPSPRALRVG